MFNWFNDQRFGVLTVRVLLLMTIGMSLLPFEPSPNAMTGGDVTFLSRVPQEELRDPLVVYGFQVVVVLASVFWLLNWLSPWSCWVVVASFAGLSALRIENSTELCHSYWLLWMLLVVHALWYSFYSSPVRSNGPVGTNQNYPAWVYFLCVLVLAWFHTLSGVGKWMAADPDWANGWKWADGVSLQMWLQMYGNPDSRLVRFLLQEVDVARVVQQAILVIELTAILAVLTPTLRRFVGVALVVYYGFFLHCFVDWDSVLGKWGVGAETVEVVNGASFPLMSYGFFLFWVCWIFFVSDRLLGSWKHVSPSQTD